MSASKYLVYAGCDNEGQVLNGQPYDGPIDSESVAQFALDTLRSSIYHASNTAWGLAELDWRGLENGADGDVACYFSYDNDSQCFDCDSDADCNCTPPAYFVFVTLADPTDS